MMNKRIASFILAMLLFAMLIPVQSFGTYIDLTRMPSLEISYQDGDLPIANAYFELHLIEEYDENGNLFMTDTFERYNVGLDSGLDLKTIARTLRGYVLSDNITPFACGYTDADGLLKKTELVHGLYLVMSERHEQDGYAYDAEPFIIGLPAEDYIGNELIYDAVVSPKSEKEELPDDGSEPTYVKRKVLKAWADEGFEYLRPEYIEVSLLRNGRVYDRVVLNAENNWRYTWENLDASYEYIIVEEPVDGYTVSVDRFGVTFLVTNTYGEEMIMPTPGYGEETPRPGTSATPRPGTSATPRPGTTITPNPDTTRTPRPDTTRSPGPDTTRTPRPDTTRSPGPDETRTPRPGITWTPYPDATETPTPGTTWTPVPGTTWTPAPGTTWTPVPGTTWTPAPGITETPAPGTTWTPAPGTTWTPAPGTTWTPAPGTTETPAPGTTETPAPGTTETPAPGTSATPNPSATTRPVPTPRPTNPPKLPQTGQLWWPVPLLMVSGLMLLAFGIIRRKNN